MKSVKSNVMIPLLAVVFALTGAFATNSLSNDGFAPELGYIETNEPCDTPVQCDTTPNPMVCTVGIGDDAIQAFGKISPESKRCLKTLYQPIQ